MQKILIFLFFFVAVLHAEQNIKTANVLLGFDKPPFIFGQILLTGIEPDIIRESFSLMNYQVNILRRTRNSS